MILKLGSKGNEVKVLQRFLGLKPDGGFGPGTEAAVKKWQTSKKLKADGIVGPTVIAKMGLVFETEVKESAPTPAVKPEVAASDYTIAQIEKAVKAKGYKWFDSSDYQLNIVGVRNIKKGRTVTNIFDDSLTLSYKIDGVWKFHSWEFTTDPGKKAMLEIKNPKGVAILKPGQYVNTYSIDLRQKTYEALKQMKPVSVYRDKNKNMTYDLSTEDKGIFGINIHKAGADSTTVENWSEGCQVFKRSAEFDEFLKICKLASKKNGNTFTYTLLESKDIK